MMYSFLNMAGTYDSRKVERYEDDILMVSTVLVTDGVHDYETAVCHPEYNDNKLVVVQAYDTIEEARAGHAQWVSVMLSSPPEYLRDCGNSFISQLLEMEDEMAMIFPRKTE